jgi:hypothetical protein
MARNVMPRKIKFSKIAIVMFLTILIWVYADLATDDTHLVPDVPVSIAKSGDSELWATFKNEGGSVVSSIAIKQIVLKGPTSRIAEVKRDLDNNLLKLAFSLDPARQDMTTVGSYTLDMLDFVREREQIRGLGGVTVESCEPNKVTIEVVKLRKRDLDIQSVDESDKALEAESITPSKISMFVPEDWGQDKAAQVMLTPGEMQPARSKGVRKIPYIVLADGQKRQSDSYVQVKLLPEEDKLEPFTISRVVVGYCYSANTQGQYKAQVQPSDERELTSEIKIRATPQAKTAYDTQSFQVMVEIEDNDRSGEEVKRPLKYNLPEEYVRKGEIKLDPEHEPVEAKFKLIPLPSAEKP